jgi:hypothetical protein
MRHVYQAQDPKWIARSSEMAEQDARLFVYEFFGNHDHSDDAAALTHTLNAILQDDLDRLWFEARSRARAALVKPSGSEQSDDLRRRFAPVLKARSLAVQQFIDPNNSRRLFPAGIEFSCPRSTLTVSYQK